MKILFISRAFPPIIGGIENQNRDLLKALSSLASVHAIINTRGKKFLPIFIPFAFFKSLLILHRFDIVLLGDGVLAPIAEILKFFYPKKKFVSIIHGLDITYANRSTLMGTIYKYINIPALKKMDKLIMVGNETITQACNLGIKNKQCVFIPNGLHPENYSGSYSRNELAKILKINLLNKKVLVRIGRYVPHKGVLWFITHVMPQLPANFILVCAGGVPKKTSTGDTNIFTASQKIIKKLHLEDRVFLFSDVSWDTIKLFLHTADLSISPNIKVHGSLEGFGINVIEAGLCGRTVLASDHEGLKDAIHNTKNGFLIPPENEKIWIEKITYLLSDDFNRNEFGKNASTYVRLHFSWDTIGKKYLNLLQSLL